MSKLNLIPNEIVGYRIHPDTWNWTVVEVKRYGPNSKFAGQEYESPLSYQKDIRNAVKYIVNYVSALEGAKLQRATFETTGVTASLEALQEAFEKAEKAAISAVDDLEKRFSDIGIDINTLNKRMLKEEDTAVNE